MTLLRRKRKGELQRRENIGAVYFSNRGKKKGEVIETLFTGKGSGREKEERRLCS